MIGDAGRRIALAVAFVHVVAVCNRRGCPGRSGRRALGQAAGGLVVIVAAEIAEHAHRAVPADARPMIVPRTRRRRRRRSRNPGSNGSPSRSRIAGTGLRPRAAVVGLAADQALVVCRRNRGRSPGRTNIRRRGRDSRTRKRSSPPPSRITPMPPSATWRCRRRRPGPSLRSREFPDMNRATCRRSNNGCRRTFSPAVRSPAVRQSPGPTWRRDSRRLRRVRRACPALPMPGLARGGARDIGLLPS